MSVHNEQNVSKNKRFSQKVLVQLSRGVLVNISKTINKRTINEIACISGLIKRVSSKITGFEFLTTMLIASSNAEQASLENISDIFRSQFQVSIKAQSIMERLNS